MRYEHQQAHHLIWVVLMVALPFLYLSALQVIPEPRVGQKDWQQPSPAAPVILSTNANGAVGFHVRGSTYEQPLQLEMEVEHPISAASVEVYIASGHIDWKPSNFLRMGILSGQGVFRFAMPEALQSSDSWTVVGWDYIRQTTVFKMSL